MIEKKITLRDLDQFNILLTKNFNYDRIRVYAVQLFNNQYRLFIHKNIRSGIAVSEMCRVIYNPVDSWVVGKNYSDGILKCFIYELLYEDALPADIARGYVKCFAQAFEFMLKRKMLLEYGS